MRRARHSLGAYGAVSAVVIAVLAACGDDRGGFDQKEEVFEPPPEAGTPEVETCYRQCSLDGRSVIDSCTGGVVEACADDLACGAAKCQEPCAAAAADRSSNGCEFYFTKPKTTFANVSCFATFVVNTSNKPATIKLELAGKELDVSRALFRTVANEVELEPLSGPLAPGESAILFVADWDPNVPRSFYEKGLHTSCPVQATPAYEADFGLFEAGISDAFRLESDAPVGVTWLYPYGGADTMYTTATLVLPVSAWAKDHIVVNGWEAVSSNGRPVTQIFASEDDTEVTIIGKKSVRNGVGFTGAAAGVPAKIALSKGQYVQITQMEELTGSLVFSNKPVVTVGGTECTYLPQLAEACDTLAQQIPAFEQWGSEYVGVGYRPRSVTTDEIVWYRMVGGRDGTELEYDPAKPGGAPTKIDAGELVLFRARANEPFVVRARDAEHPFYLAMHMTGGQGAPPEVPGYGGMGDPEFVNIVPAGQYMSSYSFYADGTYPEHSLVVVRKRTHGEFKDVWLECAGNLTDWIPIDDAGQYEYRRVDLSRAFGPGEAFGESACIAGLQRMRSEGAFTATIWGWGPFASYAYPGGMANRKLVDTPLAPVN